MAAAYVRMCAFTKFPHLLRVLPLESADAAVAAADALARDTLGRLLALPPDRFDADEEGRWAYAQATLPAHLGGLSWPDFRRTADAARVASALLISRTVTPLVFDAVSPADAAGPARVAPHVFPGLADARARIADCAGSYAAAASAEGLVTVRSRTGVQHRIALALQTQLRNRVERELREAGPRHAERLALFLSAGSAQALVSPPTRFALQLSDDVFRTAARFLLQLPTTTAAPACASCAHGVADAYGRHYVQCRSEDGLVIQRHNGIRDAYIRGLNRLCATGCAVPEPVLANLPVTVHGGLRADAAGSHARADVAVTLPDGSKILVDFVVTYPDASRPGARVTAGAAAGAAERAKYAHYGRLLTNPPIGKRLFAFAIEANGRIGHDGEACLQRIVGAWHGGSPRQMAAVLGQLRGDLSAALWTGQAQLIHARAHAQATAAPSNGAGGTGPRAPATPPPAPAPPAAEPERAPARQPAAWTAAPAAPDDVVPPAPTAAAPAPTAAPARAPTPLTPASVAPAPTHVGPTTLGKHARGPAFDADDDDDDDGAGAGDGAGGRGRRTRQRLLLTTPTTTPPPPAATTRVHGPATPPAPLPSRDAATLLTAARAAATDSDSDGLDGPLTTARAPATTAPPPSPALSPRAAAASAAPADGPSTRYVTRARSRAENSMLAPASPRRAARAQRLAAARTAPDADGLPAPPPPRSTDILARPRGGGGRATASAARRAASAATAAAVTPAAARKRSRATAFNTYTSSDSDSEGFIAAAPHAHPDATAAAAPPPHRYELRPRAPRAPRDDDDAVAGRGRDADSDHDTDNYGQPSRKLRRTGGADRAYGSDDETTESERASDATDAYVAPVVTVRDAPGVAPAAPVLPDAQPPAADLPISDATTHASGGAAHATVGRIPGGT
jgi:hypothetical protein